MPTESPCPKDDPLMIAWEEYRKTEHYLNAFKWAKVPQHTDGSLWAVFEAGFRAATQRAANLHEQIDAASDTERQRNLHGADAMGAIVEYRDKIRQTIAV